MKYFLDKSLLKENQAILIKSSGIDSDKFDISKITKDSLQNLKIELNITNELVVLMVARAIWDKGVKEYYESASILSKKYQ